WLRHFVKAQTKLRPCHKPLSCRVSFARRRAFALECAASGCTTQRVSRHEECDTSAYAVLSRRPFGFDRRGHPPRTPAMTRRSLVSLINSRTSRSRRLLREARSRWRAALAVGQLPLAALHTRGVCNSQSGIAAADPTIQPW